MEKTTLGQRLASARRDRGVSQRFVALVTGIKSQNLSRLETGERLSVHTDTLIRLCRALDVSADYLLGLSARVDLQE